MFGHSSKSVQHVFSSHLSVLLDYMMQTYRRHGHNTDPYLKLYYKLSVGNNPL